MLTYCVFIQAQMAGQRAKITLLRYQTLLESEHLVATNSEVSRSVSSVCGHLDIPQVALTPYQVHIHTVT